MLGAMLARLGWHPVLARKEWRQHRLLLSFVVILAVFFPLSFAFGTPVQNDPFEISVNEHYEFLDGTVMSTPITYMGWVGTLVDIAHGSNYPYIFLIMAAVAAGTLLLATERVPHTLAFLVTLPVSRRHIGATKFILGWLAITAMTLLMLLVFLCAFLLLPPEVRIDNMLAALIWFLRVTLVLWAVYGVSFSIGTITGSIQGTLAVTILVFIGPAFFSGIIGDFLVLTGWAPSHPAERPLRWLSQWLTPFHYLPADGSVTEGAVPIIAGMAIVAVASFLGSMKLFERNDLERTGDKLLFGDGKKLQRLFMPPFVGLTLTIFTANVFQLKGQTVILLFALFCILGERAVLWGQQWRRRRLGE
ncbi:ABC transporter permease subunit [Heliobacterium undosum]|uniref:ABC transporter permease subunit n=1 Tax=Heliomicrobium undosum TaxID=121734 RepID=A0A845L2Y9_9FIRM|nr:ABC transporter permease subunit [Heliomicrobium undosum]MZP29214.1 ABC transporter permease subunit [Heliomicrobium undosum]